MFEHFRINTTPFLHKKGFYFNKQKPLKFIATILFFRKYFINSFDKKIEYYHKINIPINPKPVIVNADVKSCIFIMYPPNFYKNNGTKAK